MKTSALSPGDYHSFYQPYVDVLGEVDLMDMMESQLDNFPRFIESIPADKWQYSYAADKWTVAEVLLHLIDAERVFQYRALRIARGDQTPLPGFDHDSYVPNSGASARSRESIINEYRSVREASLSLFRSFDEEQLNCRGTASKSTVSVGALGFLICGHQKHHRNKIREHYLET
jgi:hypothetical protein